MPSNFYDLLKYAKTGIAAPSMNNLEKIRALSLASGYPLSTITGVTPLTFHADGRPLTAWSIYGNSQQTGTPAPDDPIMPEFVGERTANLFDVTAFVLSIVAVIGNGIFSFENDIISIKSVDISDAYTLPYTNREGVYKIQVMPNTKYTVKTESKNIQNVVLENGSTETGYLHAWNGGSISFTTNPDTNFLTFRFGIFSSLPLGTTGTVKKIMLNTGSTAKPYEPYGYKIPITCAGQTVPVYLGQTQTVRRIKKLVLTGEENWELQSINSYGIANFRTLNELVNIDGDRSALCSHFYQSTATISDSTEPCFHISITSPTLYIRIQSTTASNATEFRTWLAQQYAANTPVTIWYVLAEPTTSIVNEPLCKIGNYADELHSTDAGVTIPTTRGQNVLTAGTDLQPSSVSITGHIKLT